MSLLCMGFLEQWANANALCCGKPNQTSHQSFKQQRTHILADKLLLTCADAFVRVGNRTECALLELCAKLGVEVGTLQQAHQIVQVYPFSSDRKRMTSITFQTGAS